MSEIGSLESLQSLHRELLAVCQHRYENVEVLRLSLVEHADAFKRLLDKPARDSKSRSTVQSGMSNRVRLERIGDDVDVKAVANQDVKQESSKSKMTSTPSTRTSSTAHSSSPTSWS